jgi:hypothetical protein
MRTLALVVSAAALCGCRSLPEYRPRGGPSVEPELAVGVPPGGTKAPPKGGTPTEPPKGGTPTATPVIRDDREAAAAVRKRLQQPIPRVAWPNIPWPDAVEFLRRVTELNIVSMDEALAGEGIAADRKVTLDAADLTGADALDKLVGLMGAGDAADSRAAWFIRGNVVVITTRARAPR